MTALIFIALCLPSAVTDDRPMMVVVIGAPGTSEYGAIFHKAAERWRAAAREGNVESVEIGSSPASGQTDHDQCKAILANATKASTQPLWLVLIGHGTFDGKEAKFNLRGPDITDLEISEWLAPFKRPLIIINGASASGPFLNRLSGPNRVVITATKSGSEINYTRFNQYLAEAIGDSKSDLDKDGQVSLLEAFLTGGNRVNDYYRSHSQLASEHALIDDNGDRLGTPPTFFRGVRATQRAKNGASLDGVRAHQMHLVPSRRERAIPPEIRRKRDELELSIAALKDRKTSLAEKDYELQLEKLLVELARLYRSMPKPR